MLKEFNEKCNALRNILLLLIFPIQFSFSISYCY